MKHNVSLIEYEKQYGGFKKHTETQVALFDDRKMSEEDVWKAIQENDEYHPDIIFCSKAQYLSVFASLIEKNKKKKAKENPSD